MTWWRGRWAQLLPVGARVGGFASLLAGSLTPEGNKYLTWVNANVVVPFGFYDPAEGH